jgi:hypothetical protein
VKITEGIGGLTWTGIPSDIYVTLCTPYSTVNGEEKATLLTATSPVVRPPSGIGESPNLGGTTC